MTARKTEPGSRGAGSTSVNHWRPRPALCGLAGVPCVRSATSVISWTLCTGSSYRHSWLPRARCRRWKVRL